MDESGVSRLMKELACLGPSHGVGKASRGSEGLDSSCPPRRLLACARRTGFVLHPSPTTSLVCIQHTTLAFQCPCDVITCLDVCCVCWADTLSNSDCHMVWVYSLQITLTCESTFSSGGFLLTKEVPLSSQEMMLRVPRIQDWP